jgi:hypothetical protein
MRVFLAILVALFFFSSCGKNYCLAGFGQCKEMFEQTDTSGENNGTSGCTDGISNTSLKIPHVPGCKIYASGATYTFTASGGAGGLTYFSSCTTITDAGTIDGSTGKFTTKTASLGAAGTQVTCEAWVTDGSVTTGHTQFTVEQQ